MNDSDSETLQLITRISERNQVQTSKVLNALEHLTEWMEEVQHSIDNINKRLKVAEKTNKYQDEESEFYITKEDFEKGMSRLHKFTEEVCGRGDDGLPKDFYN